MSATELCKRTGIPKSAMSQYINGKFEPRQNRVYLIAKALNVSEAWLMGYDVPAERKDNEQEIETDISFDKFTYAMYNETKELTEEDKEALLNMARILKKKIVENK